MTNLTHPLNLNMIRNAAEEAIRGRLLWAKYGTEITEHVEGIITDVLEGLAGSVESEPVTDRDDVETIVSDFCDEVAGSLEISRGNGLTSEMTEGDVIYTADILNYYAENSNDVDEALADAHGSLGEFTTISEAMALGVELALANIAEEEVSDVIYAFETWAKDEMVDRIFN